MGKNSNAVVSRVDSGKTWKFNPREYNCRICNAKIANEETMRQAGTWYHLRLVGNQHADRMDATVGYFCGLDCLLVSVMRPLGMRESQVRDWLRDL
jgi:hypothetical protein